MLKGIVLLGALAMPQAATITYVIPHSCIISVSAGPDAECSGPSLNALVCKGIKLKYTTGCEQLHVEEVK